MQLFVKDFLFSHIVLSSGGGAGASKILGGQKVWAGTDAGGGVPPTAGSGIAPLEKFFVKILHFGSC